MAVAKQDVSLPSGNDELDVDAPDGGTVSIRVGDSTVVCRVISPGGGNRSGQLEVDFKVIAAGGGN